jgi:hypothetical protein
MRRREAERLAAEQMTSTTMPNGNEQELSVTPLTELQEVGADRAAIAPAQTTSGPTVPPEPEWRALRESRERGGDRGCGRKT